MVQTADTGQETVVEHEVIRTAFDSLFAAVETAPHNLERGIRLWHDGRPIRMAKEEAQIQTEVAEWLEYLLTKSFANTIKLVNAYRDNAGLVEITERSQVLSEENINLFVIEELQSQVGYAASLPFRIPEDQLAELNAILSSIGLLPEGATFCNFTILIQTYTAMGRSDDLKISFFLVFDTTLYPFMAEHVPGELVRQILYSLTRARGTFREEPYDELGLYVHMSWPGFVFHSLEPGGEGELANELRRLKEAILASSNPIEERWCEQKRFIGADLDLLAFLESIVKQIEVE